MSNDLILIESILEQERKKSAPDLDTGVFFELFSFLQILKDFDLSYDEVKIIKTGGSNDGGIDGFAMFLNGNLIEEKIIAKDITKNPVIDLYIIQSKSKNAFEERVLEKFIVSCINVLDFSKKQNIKDYNSDILEKINLFKNSYISLASKFPKLSIHFCYVTKGDSIKISNKIKTLSEELKKEAKKLFEGSEVNVNLYGARELLALSRKEKSYELQLDTINHISLSSNDYIVLSQLGDYYKFITDENQNLRWYLFESNVRDYQGNNEVNKDIIKTLSSAEKLDFWWLNNGITILASKALIIGKKITLSDVQIVNGLQTTRCIHDFIKNNPRLDHARNVLIKIIIADDILTKDKIIKATNFQTSIPSASLRATEKIQRDIEEYFKKNDLYYDRRKSFYKNQGISIDKIISISYLAQAVSALLFKEPHISRANPSSIVKNDESYQKIFNEFTDLKLYLKCAQIMKIVESLIENMKKDKIASARNFRFHLATAMLVKILNKNHSDADYLKDLDLLKLNKNTFKKTSEEFYNLVKKYNKKDIQLDVIAKSKDFSSYLIDKLLV